MEGRNATGLRATRPVGVCCTGHHNMTHENLLGFQPCRRASPLLTRVILLSEADVWEPGKPSQNENEYFARQDAEWLSANRARLDAERLSKDQASTGMVCPRCGGKLGERIYHNVRIDVCATCRGVWLDRGELHMLAHVEATAMLHVIHDIDAGTL